MRAILLAGVAAVALGIATAPAQAQFWNVLSPEIDTCFDVGETDEDALVVQCFHNNIKDPNGGDNEDNTQGVWQTAKLKLKGVDSDRLEDADARITQLGYNEIDDDDNNADNEQYIVQSAYVRENSYSDNGEVYENTVVFQGGVNEVEDGDGNLQSGTQTATVNIVYE
jgi:hypothetical protein